MYGSFSVARICMLSAVVARIPLVTSSGLTSQPLRFPFRHPAIQVCMAASPFSERVFNSAKREFASVMRKVASYTGQHDINGRLGLASVATLLLRPFPVNPPHLISSDPLTLSGRGIYRKESLAIYFALLSIVHPNFHTKRLLCMLLKMHEI